MGAAKTEVELKPQQWKAVGKAGAGPQRQQRALDFHLAWGVRE